MAKRKTVFERTIEQFDLEIAALQLARQKLLDRHAADEVDKRNGKQSEG